MKHHWRIDGNVWRKNKREFFVNFTRIFLPWVYELTRCYKERGEFPMMACWLLPSYYTNDQDVEIAVFASVLIPDDDRVYQHVGDFRRLMGDNPYQWFISRGFVSLGTGDRRYHNTGGIRNNSIANYFALLWDKWNNRHQALPEICASVFSQDRRHIRLDTLRLVLGTSDGIGRGLWTIAPPEPCCPITQKVIVFLETFCPEYRKFGTIQEVIRLFGFDRDSDFFYASLAYAELQRRNPEGCSRLATVYQNRYKQGCLLGSVHWTGSKGILPDIDF